jgi:hypothetical protein
MENVKHGETDEPKGPATQIFYEVNKAQQFEFPHSNCDEYIDEELLNLYFKQSGFGDYCRRTVLKITGESCNLEELQHNPQFVNYVVVWMRLKFIAELVDPVHYAHYFRIWPSPKANKPLRLPKELLELYNADTTELFAYVDQLANQIQFRWIEMMLGWNGTGRTRIIDDLCTRLNTELQTIRSRINPLYLIRGVDPYEFALVPFLEFHLELRRVLLSP